MNENKSFRPDIQGLRAIAVLCVVFYHARIPGFYGGYVGVDVFFVISGYLITRMLSTELTKTGYIDLLGFYTRRIKRLLPASACVLSITSVIVLLLAPPLQKQELAPAIFYSATYICNFWFASNATHYLAPNIHLNPVLHMWSLAVEEQFYLFWPLLLLFLYRIKSGKYFDKISLSVFLSFILISFTASIILTDISQPWAFFSPITRAWEFGIGGMVYFTSRDIFLRKQLNDFCFLIGSLFLITSILIFNNATHFPGSVAMLPVSGAGLLIFAGNQNGSNFSQLISGRIFIFLGDISYSWYLWHWPLQILFHHLGLGLTGPGKLLAPTVSLLFAWLSYQVVENPVRRGSLSPKSKSAALALGAMLTLVSSTAAIVIRQVSKHELTAPLQREFASARTDLPIIYRDGCHLSIPEISIHNCVFGDAHAEYSVVLFGDSHAAQWFPALDELAHKHDWRLVSLTKSGCPAVPISISIPQTGGRYVSCDIWRKRAIMRISQEQPNLIIIADSSSYTSGKDISKWTRSLKLLLDNISEPGRRLLVIRDTPEAGFNIPTCLSAAIWWKKGLDACDFPSGPALRAKHFEAIKHTVQQIKDAAIIDMSDKLCNKKECYATIANTVVYIDDQHLTASWSKHMEEPLWKSIKGAEERIAKKSTLNLKAVLNPPIASFSSN